MFVLRSAVVVMVALVLIVSFTVPGEDAPETEYDESESVPFENTPEHPGVVSQTDSQEAHVRAPVALLRGKSRSSCGAERSEQPTCSRDSGGNLFTTPAFSLRC